MALPESLKQTFQSSGGLFSQPKNGNKQRNVLIILLISNLTRDGKFSLSFFSLCFYCFICYECAITPKILDGFNRSDIAWKDAKYAQIWEYLRDEFELTQRFASLDFKLKFVEVLSLLEIHVIMLHSCC
jgi:hypothetical protein